MTDRVADARLAEIETEYADLLKSVDDDGSTLIDGPGAASAFYGSLSLSEVVSLCGELIKHRRSQDAGGWRLVPTKPTAAMEEAFKAAKDTGVLSPTGKWRTAPYVIWTAMIAAAPSPTMEPTNAQ